MIKIEDLTAVGTVRKPHGIKGELNAGFEAGFDPGACEYLICRTDGLFVPFYLQWQRQKSAGAWLLKFEGIDTVEAAAALSSCSLYIDSAEAGSLAAEELPLDFFIGYKVYDKGVYAGMIKEIDYRTANVLCMLERPDGGTVPVPLAEDFIEGADREARELHMNLPEGLLDLN